MERRGDSIHIWKTFVFVKIYREEIISIIKRMNEYGDRVNFSTDEYFYDSEEEFIKDIKNVARSKIIEIECIKPYISISIERKSVKLKLNINDKEKFWIKNDIIKLLNNNVVFKAWQRIASTFIISFIISLYLFHENQIYDSIVRSVCVFILIYILAFSRYSIVPWKVLDCRSRDDVGFFDKHTAIAILSIFVAVVIALAAPILNRWYG